jgi:hypothetical protein
VGTDKVKPVPASCPSEAALWPGHGAAQRRLGWNGTAWRPTGVSAGARGRTAHGALSAVPVENSRRAHANPWYAQVLSVMPRLWAAVAPGGAVADTPLLGGTAIVGLYDRPCVVPGHGNRRSGGSITPPGERSVEQWWSDQGEEGVTSVSAAALVDHHAVTSATEGCRLSAAASTAGAVWDQPLLHRWVGHLRTPYCP